MRAIKYVLVLLLLAAIVGAIALWRLPADVGYRYASRWMGPLQLTGVRGTIWNGHADGVSLLGNDLGELDWTAAKSSLLRGDVVADVRIKGTDVDVAGVMTRRGDGAVSAENLRFSLPASRLDPLFADRHVQLHGTITGVLEHATWMTASLSNATGTAHWSDVAVSGEVEARFTDLLAEFASQPDGSVAGTVHDDGRGNIAVDGRFTLHAPTVDGEAMLRARVADPQVVETLRHIGEPLEDGRSRVVVQGRFLRLF